MATKYERGKDSPELGGWIDDILVDAYGDDEQLWAFRQAFEDKVVVPAEAFVVGEPVTVMRIDYDGNERRGLTARCRREDGSEQVIAACDLIFPEGSAAARYMAAYRRWLGIEPHPQMSLSKTRRRVPKAIEEDIDIPGCGTHCRCAEGERCLLSHCGKGACHYSPTRGVLGYGAGRDHRGDPTEAVALRGSSIPLG